MTRDNGRSTINSVTVTVDTVAPVRVGPTQTHKTIQAAIDAAAPGSLILVDPGIYEELVVMSKPVRLQGAGAATMINAVKRPDSKLLDWRSKVKGLIDSGAVDLLPGQPGPDFNLVGAGLFGTELGAGITVLAKNTGCNGGTPPPGCFNVVASRIDGFTISGADGGGGIFVNGYAHDLRIANNHVTGNSGVLHGGIRVGHPSLPLAGDGPFGYNRNLNIHHNAITLNGAQSDVGAAGGIALCTGSDNYTVSRNYVCGNFNLGDGGGIGHLGLSTPGLIQFNQVLFNQVFNQGLNRSGGGVLVAGEPPVATALTLGAGNVTLDANLIQGNQAATGHGGGLRTQLVNGRDVELNQQWLQQPQQPMPLVSGAADQQHHREQRRGLVGCRHLAPGHRQRRDHPQHDRQQRQHRHRGRSAERGGEHLYPAAGRHLVGAPQPRPRRGHPGQRAVAEELLEPGSHPQHHLAQPGLLLRRDHRHAAAAPRLDVWRSRRLPDRRQLLRPRRPRPGVQPEPAVLDPDRTRRATTSPRIRCSSPSTATGHVL